MNLIQSARLNGHHPYAYLKHVLTRLPTQRACEIDQLLPHKWVPALLRLSESGVRQETPSSMTNVPVAAPARRALAA